jgi:hypothetical protein
VGVFVNTTAWATARVRGSRLTPQGSLKELVLLFGVHMLGVALLDEPISRIGERFSNTLMSKQVLVSEGDVQVLRIIPTFVSG